MASSGFFMVTYHHHHHHHYYYYYYYYYYYCQNEGWDEKISGFLEQSMPAISKLEEEVTSKNHYEVCIC